MKIKLWVKLRENILDPQGSAVLGVLNDMGYKSVQSVRVGKLIEIEINENNEIIAHDLVKKMANDLLANWIMEDYEIVK